MMFLLVEGRLEQAQSKYSPVLKNLLQWSDEKANEFVGEFANQDPSGNLKYFNWMMKRIVGSLAAAETLKHATEDDATVFAFEKANEIKGAVEKFHKHSQRLKNKDINSYKTAKELSDAIDSLGQSKTSKKKQVKSGAERLYEDDDILIIRPETHEQVCLYGAGSKWCITEKDASHYSDYVKENTLFYIMFLKNVPEGNIFHKIAYSVERDNDNDLHDTTFWDVQDQGYASDELAEAMREWATRSPSSDILEKVASKILGTDPSSPNIEDLMDEDARNQPRTEESYTLKERIARDGISSELVEEVIQSVEENVDLQSSTLEYREGVGFVVVWTNIDYLAIDMGDTDSGRSLRRAHYVLDGHDWLDLSYYEVEDNNIEELWNEMPDDLREAMHKSIDENYAEELASHAEDAEYMDKDQQYLDTVRYEDGLSSLFRDAYMDGLQAGHEAELASQTERWVRDHLQWEGGHWLTARLYVNLSDDMIQEMLDHRGELYDDYLRPNHFEDFDIDDIYGFDVEAALEHLSDQIQ
jgi:hypothetical protein